MSQLALPPPLAEAPELQQDTAPAPREIEAPDSSEEMSHKLEETSSYPPPSRRTAQTPQVRGRTAPGGDGEEHEDEVAQDGVVEQLLRAPARFLETTEEAELVSITRTLLLTVAAGAGAFGAVVGAFRGGIQIAYAALKIPLLLLGTMAICMPAFISITRALRLRLEAKEVVVLSLGACARFSLVLAGLAPVLWLLSGWLGYHSTALVVAAVCGFAGLSASGLLFRGLSRRGGGALAGMAFIAVFGVVGMQTSWLLRPFLVRPRTESIPFVRGIEGDLLDSVWRSSRSAAGIYEEHE